jgi:hypothetical protein
MSLADQLAANAQRLKKKGENKPREVSAAV